MLIHIFQVMKAKELDMSIKKDIMMGVTSLCNCPFNYSAISSGECGCQPSSFDSDDGCGTSNVLSHVTYHAAINGTGFGPDPWIHRRVEEQ